MAVTFVPRVYQWAEMQTIALGLGNEAAKARHAAAKPLDEMAFMGLPCPTKIAGMGPLSPDAGTWFSTRLAYIVGQTAMTVYVSYGVERREPPSM